MKIIGGETWNMIRSSRMPLRLLGYIMIGPGLLGLILALSVVMWIPAWNWPSTITVAITYALISIMFMRLLFGLIQRVRITKVIDIEESCKLLGVMFALLFGIYTFGINPKKWGEVAPLKDKDSDEQVVKS